MIMLLFAADDDDVKISETPLKDYVAIRQMKQFDEFISTLN